MSANFLVAGMARSYRTVLPMGIIAAFWFVSCLSWVNQGFQGYSSISWR